MKKTKTKKKKSSQVFSKGLTQLRKACPLSGKKFEYSSKDKKFIDVEGRETRIIAPPVDHDHATGFIRGILSEKLNLLLDQWEKQTYGKLSKPKELTDYQNDPPAYKCIGKVKYK